MKTVTILACCVCLCASICFAQDKPKLKITPGQVIVPTDAMRRIWGELVSIDLATRTGKFRKDGTDEITNFTVLPYAELLHHSAFGDLSDFRIGERAIFRMHENEAGEWTWLTYIQDEMNFLNNHREYYHVDSIDAAKGTFTCTQANADKSYIRTTGILLETEKDTRYWKDGKPAKIADIVVGDKLRTKTHGVGKEAHRMCWEVFLDDASLLKFQSEQKAVHSKRLAELGAPCYVDSVTENAVEITLFQEGGDIAKALKIKQNVRLSPTGVDRLPTSEFITGVISAAKMQGNLGKATITLSSPATNLKTGSVVRLLLVQ